MKYRIGEIIKIDNIDYELLDIKEGGMAYVLILKRIPDIDPNPFMKIYRDYLAAKLFKSYEGIDEEIKYFKHELRIWLELENPNTVPLLKITQIQDDLAAIMPSYDSSLRDLMDRVGQLDFIDASYIILNIMHGLYSAYKEDKIVHQDIKPENVLIERLKETNNQLFLISDWGIANIQNYYQPKEPDFETGSINRFLTMSKMGTLPYMSPERLRGHYTDFKSDIYSLGIMFFEMLTGILPFDDHRNKEMGYQIIDADIFHSADNILKNYPDGRAKKIILKCINPDLKKRYSNYERLIHDLYKIVKKYL